MRSDWPTVALVPYSASKPAKGEWFPVAGSTGIAAIGAAAWAVGSLMGTKSRGVPLTSMLPSDKYWGGILSRRQAARQVRGLIRDEGDPEYGIAVALGIKNSVGGPNHGLLVQAVRQPDARAEVFVISVHARGVRRGCGLKHP